MIRRLLISLALAATQATLGMGSTVDWHTSDGGGSMQSSGGGFILSGTIAQPDAGQTPMTGGTFELTGGFWNASVSASPVLLAVTSPQGGEVWAGSSVHTITWFASHPSGIDSVSIQYSIDGGSNFALVAAGEPNDSVYSWTIPGTSTDSALVRIIAYGSNGNTGQDVSDSLFTIAEPDTTSPQISVITPNGAELWSTGSTQDITWAGADAAGIDSVSIHLSLDGGSNFALVAAGEPNDSLFTWTVPETPTDSALVRITAYDPSGNTGQDVSDSLFTIAEPDTTQPTIQVMTPNGGEEWLTGSSRDITWLATDAVGIDSVSIHLSLNGGSNFALVAAGEPNDSLFTWTVPETPTDSALVRITAYDPSGNTGQDVSDSLFTIAEPDTTSPQVTVLTPNGAELWAIGSIHDITWVATDSVGVDSLSIHLSVDGGASYSLITAGEPNDSLYAWTISGTATDSALVRIIAYDPSGNTGQDVSDSLFTIAEPDTTTPQVTVLTPNGGELWPTGSIQNVTWSASDSAGVDSVSIHLSLDGGANYSVVSAGEPNDSVYAWTIPGTPTDSALVRIVAYDPSGNTGQDISDSLFAIADTTQPAIQVVTPNGGEEWLTGSTHDITWVAADAGGIDSVSIHLSLDGGFNFALIAGGELNDSLYVWTVPETPTDSALVRIIAYDPSGNAGQDASDNLFTIAEPDTTSPQVTVITPNGAELWAIGSTQNITWLAADSVGVDSVSIQYSIDGGANYSLIAAGEPNDSLYAWTVPETPTDSALVRITAYDPSGNTGQDVCDSLFAIADTTQPAIQVVTPNGGEEWLTGSTQDISWVAADAGGIDSLSVQYSIDGGFSFALIAGGESNDSLYTWTVPETPTDSALVRIIAYDPSGNTGQDVSDSLFTIAEPDTTSPQVNVITPNGAELWPTGSVQDVTWAATDSTGIDSVAIHLSLDGGSTFTLVAAGEPNDSLYTWTVPDTPTDSALVRILAYDPSGNTGQDVSDSLFVIVFTPPPAVQIISPNGGEMWRVGEVRNILWSVTNGSGLDHAEISYSSNSGFSYKPIATVGPADSVFSWTLPDHPSAGTLVRVIAFDTFSAVAGDTSDAIFTILPYNLVAQVSIPPANTRGLAFDGTDLYYTANRSPSDPDFGWIFKVSTTGTLLDTLRVPTAVAEGPMGGAHLYGADGGPLAWDGSFLWTMHYESSGLHDMRLRKIDPASGTVVDSCSLVDANPGHPAIPGVGDFADGLAWTGSHLVVSSEGFGVPYTWLVMADTACGIASYWQHDAVGNIAATSGVASDGTYLWHVWLGNTFDPDALPSIKQTDLFGNETGLSFNALHNMEDLAYDPVTFAPTCVVWGTTPGLGLTAATLYAYAVPCGGTELANVITSPNGGETWSAGTAQDITWIPDPGPGLRYGPLLAGGRNMKPLPEAATGADAIDLFYSVDGGLSFMSIAQNVPNDSLYTWIVPPTLSDTTLIKIVSKAAGFVVGEDISDGFFTIADSVTIGTDPILGNRVVLRQNAPNPFSTRTAITFQLPASTPVTVRVFDMAGRLVTTLVESLEFPAGMNRIVWDGTGSNGIQVGSGIYFYQLKARGRTTSKKMLRIP